jgi:hypothetical protein
MAMRRNWIAYMTGDVRADWGALAGQFTELGALLGNADALLQKAMDKAERPHVVAMKRQSAFAALKEKTRFFRDRHFKTPSLTGMAGPRWASA